jgi:hypothetical protein
MVIPRRIAPSISTIISKREKERLAIHRINSIWKLWKKYQIATNSFSQPGTGKDSRRPVGPMTG